MIKANLDPPGSRTYEARGIIAANKNKSVAIFGKNHLENSCSQTVVVMGADTFYVREISVPK